MDNRLKTDNRAKENCAMKLYQMTYPETGVTYRLDLYRYRAKDRWSFIYVRTRSRDHGYERFMVDKNLHLAAERYGAVRSLRPDILGEIFQTMSL